VGLCGTVIDYMRLCGISYDNIRQCGTLCDCGGLYGTVWDCVRQCKTEDHFVTLVQTIRALQLFLYSALLVFDILHFTILYCTVYHLVQLLQYNSECRAMMIYSTVQYNRTH